MLATLAWLPLLLPTQDPGPLSVRVTDALSGAPLADAEVVCVSLGKPDTLRWNPPISDVGFWDQARAGGRSARTDGAGRVEFAGLEGGAIASCLRGELYAERWVTELQPETVELELERDVELRVRTLDARGAPLARVAVGLVSRPVARPNARNNGFEVWRAIAASDTTGTARIPHAQRWLRGGTGMTLELALALPCSEPQRIVLDLGAPLDARDLELVVPPTGSVRLLAPGVARGYARLRSARPADTPAATMWSHYAPLRAEIVDGVAEFAHVGAGVELEYEAQWAGLAQPRRGRAPAIPADARSEIRLDEPSERAVLVGRFVDEALRPIASASIAVTTTVSTRGSSMSIGGRSTTTEGGRFRIELAELAPPPGSRRVVEFSHRTAQRIEYARLELSSGVLAGENDLGDVQLCAAGSDARLRRLSDDELEREYARSVDLLSLNRAWTRDFETCATEMSRRGGERWVALFRRELEALRRAAGGPGDPRPNSVSDFELLMALRRAERKPDPAVLEIGPQSRLDTTLPELPRIAVRVRNVDPAESFTYSSHTFGHVRIEARSTDGRVPPRRPDPSIMGGGPAEAGPLPPGASSTDGGLDDWIELELGEQFELGEAGEYEVRLRYSLDDEIAFADDVRGYMCAQSAPVTIRVRTAAK